ncbi:Golgi apparatus membrane protein TVP23 homolog B-like [Paramacrobiotus metropolitanus]|uniref:Golgi apparatus membrane protein TVP23 homolog B-like n=1 Tax=Paramacrobiotus metropolitanus TaxID=2943436 RepID=UPI002445DF6F|nr:Golgi apparatus membrane protein TVP23 homolog B-like [Paramacrobiotus metropolitanus]
MSSYEFGVGDDQMTVNNQGGRFLQPGYVAVHLLFRIAAVITYLICSFVAGFVTSFIVIVFLLSIDFWICKNVTGRKLVGLRWWNYVDDEGKSKWIYESRKPEEGKPVNPAELKIFWSALIIAQVVWGIFFFWKLISFDMRWLVLDCIANFLNGANLFGYLRCKFGKKDAENAAMKYIAPQIFRNAWSGMTSRFSRQGNANNRRGDDYNNLTDTR